jgi:hypothetical protein
LTHLIADAAGATQKYLTHTGPGQGQIIQLSQGRDHATALLIHDAIEAQAPAAAARQARITAGDEVVEDATAAQFNGGIGHVPQWAAVGSDQGRIKESGQALQGGRIGVGGHTLDKRLMVIHAP